MEHPVGQRKDGVSNTSLTHHNIWRKQLHILYRSEGDFALNCLLSSVLLLICAGIIHITQ